MFYLIRFIYFFTFSNPFVILWCILYMQCVRHVYPQTIRKWFFFFKKMLWSTNKNSTHNIIYMYHLAVHCIGYTEKKEKTNGVLKKCAMGERFIIIIFFSFLLRRCDIFTSCEDDVSPPSLAHTSLHLCWLVYTS